MKNKTILFLAIMIISFSSSWANLIDDEDENSIDQNSLDALSSELTDLNADEKFSQFFIPPSENSGSSKIANQNAPTVEEFNEESDEVKRKEAAIMRDLDEHAKPLESPLTNEEKIDSPPLKEEGPQKIIPETKKSSSFQPRLRKR